MKINENNIDIYNASLLEKTINHSSFLNTHEWIRGGYKPQNLYSQFQDAPIDISVMIHGETEKDLQNNISSFINDIAVSTIAFKKNDIEYEEYLYNVILASHETSPSFVDTLTSLCTSTLTISLYATEIYKATVTKDIELNVSSFSLEVEGNKETPCILKLTVTQAMTSLTIIGFKENICVSTLYKDDVLIIDAENGIVTINNKNAFNQYDSWDFPMLSPGSNTLTFSQIYFTGTISYKPRYV